jgi:hypothetical protein
VYQPWSKLDEKADEKAPTFTAGAHLRNPVKVIFCSYF